MLTDITLGQYFPGSSVLHRMDPRVKIILLFFFVVALFVFDNNPTYAIMTVFSAMLIASSGVPAGVVLKSVKPLWWIILFTFLIHIFSTPGEAIARVWICTITLEGVIRGFVISLRLALLIMVSSLLMFTTTPIMMTDALEDLFSPFKRLGFPAHELAMMMTIALGFIPILLAETDKIIKAQQSRGADFSEGNILKKVKGLIPILVPLFISAFRRADELANAMESRCYRGGNGRTRMKKLQVKGLDYICSAGFALLFAGLIVLKVVIL